MKIQKIIEIVLQNCTKELFLDDYVVLAVTWKNSVFYEKDRLKKLRIKKIISVFSLIKDKNYKKISF